LAAPSSPQAPRQASLHVTCQVRPARRSASSESSRAEAPCAARIRISSSIEAPRRPAHRIRISSLLRLRGSTQPALRAYRRPTAVQPPCNRRATAVQQATRQALSGPTESRDPRLGVLPYSKAEAPCAAAGPTRLYRAILGCGQGRRGGAVSIPGRRADSPQAAPHEGSPYGRGAVRTGSLPPRRLTLRTRRRATKLTPGAGGRGP
jgi:hypothetical protein